MSKKKLHWLELLALVMGLVAFVSNDANPSDAFQIIVVIVQLLI